MRRMMMKGKLSGRREENEVMMRQRQEVKAGRAGQRRQGGVQRQREMGSEIPT